MDKPHVLVVDDNLTIRKLATMVLNRAGFEVSTAGSGREALDLLGEGLWPDILLLDHSLPDMEGDQVLAQLPEDLRRHTRVLLTTGYDSQHLLSRYPADLRMQTLQKPWDTGDLLQAVSLLQE